jgi:hypothetical protein
MPLLRHDRYQRGGVVTGQGLIDPGCAWCGLPAVGDVEVRPAQYRSLGVDPLIGDRGAYQRLVRSAVRVPVCDQHRQITIGQAPAIGVPRDRKTTAVEQLGMFPVTADERLRTAIYREIDR